MIHDSHPSFHLPFQFRRDRAYRWKLRFGRDRATGWKAADPTSGSAGSAGSAGR